MVKHLPSIFEALSSVPNTSFIERKSLLWYILDVIFFNFPDSKARLPLANISKIKSNTVLLEAAYSKGGPSSADVCKNFNSRELLRQGRVCSFTYAFSRAFCEHLESGRTNQFICKAIRKQSGL